jgi:diacylglycerol kinase (ATP)
LTDRFRIRARLASFRDALRGVAVVVQTQHNAWIHLSASLAVVGLGLWLGVSRTDWCWLVLAMTLVWAAEAGNTALERLADAAVPERHPLVRDAKDAAAGAVLVMAIGAAAIGLLVLGPPLWAALSPA